MTQTARLGIQASALLAAALLAAAPAGAAPNQAGDDDEPDVESGGPTGGLLPIPGLLRPAPRTPQPGGAPAAKPVVLGGCSAAPLGVSGDRLPFGPGELLSYDVAVLGMRTGRVRLKMGDLTHSDGVAAYPLVASAKTTGFLSVLGELDGKMVSFFDPASFLPVRMVSQTRSKAPFQGATYVREDAAFGVDGRVAGRLSWRDDRGEHVQQGKVKASSDLLDVLSVVYYARARALTEGAPFCFDLYHRRRLYRVEGVVGGIETVSPPYGARRGRRLDATLRRVGRGKAAGSPRSVSVWLTPDADRLPLLVRVPDQLGTIEVRLVSHVSGRRLVRPAP